MRKVSLSQQPVRDSNAMCYQRLIGRPGFSTVCFLVLAVFGNLSGYAQQDSPDAPSLSEIEAGLRKNPPRLDQLDQRESLIAGLETWIDRDDTVYWDANPQTSNRELVAYYLRAILRVLDEAESTEVKSGAVVWKLYSSGFLVKTSDTVFAIDAVEGPFKSIRRSPDDQSGYLFRWTPEMRKRFGKLVKTMFITHRHYDHASYALARAVGAEGHTIVVPPEFKKVVWAKEAFEPQLRTLTPETETRLGELTVRSFQGVQSMQRNDEGKYYVLPTDPENNVYLIRTSSGFTFLHNGDNRGLRFNAWLRQAADDGWSPDVWFKILLWPKTLVKDVNQIASPVIVPGHEWEMGHKPKYGTSKLLPFYRYLAPKLVPQKKLLVLTWGERFHFQASPGL